MTVKLIYTLIFIKTNNWSELQPRSGQDVILQIVLIRRLKLAVGTLDLVSRVDELHLLLQTVNCLPALRTDLTESVVVFFVCDIVDCPFMIPQVNGRPEFV